MLDKNDLLRRLKNEGIQIKHLGELVDTNEKYPKAIPILVEFLLADSLSSDDKDSIVRALTVPYAKGKAGNNLLTLYELTDKSDMSLRWAIGNALEVVATIEEVSVMLEIVSELDNGMSRQMFVLALGKFRTDDVEQTLINLLDNDDEVLGHVISSLGKIGSVKAVEKINKYKNHSKSYIRKEVSKALKKIHKL